MEDKKGLLLLFQRPMEPIFTAKDNGKAAFDLPESFYTERYKNNAPDIESRFGSNVETKITLNDVKKPDLSFAKPLSRKQQFSLFIDSHKRIAGKLIDLFLNAPDTTTFLAIAAYSRDRINATLFQYAFSVAMQHRPDTKDLSIPNIVEIFPMLFVDPSVINTAREESSVFADSSNRMHIEIPENYTASDREDEQRLAYFREDIGINIHHWHWHLVYPTEGPQNVINKDRRGELFYYMHHQILARYNAERFCNNLSRARPLTSFRDPIAEAYFPKIISSLNNRTYPGRVQGSVLKDVDREDNMVEVGDLDRWRDRIYEAIDQGHIVDAAGKKVPLDPVKGIDILGNIVEATALSPNRQLYGNLHNMGHNLISFSHDPDYRHLEDFGVMGDVTTAMRDPIFYRWHGFIDSVFNRYKATLPAYADNDLGFTGVNVDSLEIKIDKPNATANILLTYKQKSDVDLAAGIDFGANGNVFAHFTHPQHAPFIYTIQATNTSNAARKATCRIFLAPRTDDRGLAFKFSELRNLMIEMDKFTVDLKPGQNIIKRKSEESSVTIPYNRSFRRLGASAQPSDAEQLAEFRFCGCGWPQHMLLPRGSLNGTTYDVFVMLSDYTDDEVVQTFKGADLCGDAHSFCGLKDKLYPDKRAMGYPFDRTHTAAALENFIAPYPNMKTGEIRIKFNNIVIERDSA